MAPKKKKSGNKKLAKMTEEQRLIYLEQKRLAEEEMRKKKEDMLTQFLKDKLAKEEKSTKFNLNKLQNQWRVIMREAKAQELKKDIEVLSQTFERVIDRKEAIIKSLVKDIEEAEEQYQMALRSHLQNEDRLIDLQQRRLRELKDEFTQEQEVIKIEFDMEREKIQYQHKKEMHDIQDINFAMEEEWNEQESEAKQDFQSLRDEIKNKNIEEKHALRIQLEGTVEDLWRQFQQALKNYNETTEERKVAFENLKNKDEKSAKEIETQMRKLQRIQDNMSQLKAKMAMNARECDERNRLIKEQREVVGVQFHELKAEMNKMRDSERAQLTQLTLKSNAAIKQLTAKLEKGERIVKLSEMCRKLETEQEKVLPFYASSLSPEEEEDVAVAMQESPSEGLAEILHEYHSLENFWKRYNKVLLDKLALDKEKNSLLQENQQLRAILKQYLDGISVNDEILSTHNPLFIVNNKTNVKLSVPVMDPRVKRSGPTVVEAAHVVKHAI
ncbi:dynein regulatory complex subunit 2 [Exaiptasia diaphana]|uniref:Dynein regulatory complex subunit 2 n=1 Tax=Exaiptasia diaphana TaxID=2652724 RepID=A0A913Y430_EXADI|nr:dynein regulatory complex subunit 2 [Exaiptasia diaphana]KXJ28944.1 Coiled-coil domain-containing protein 65 [Exaiptasia diaphana]